MKSLFAKQILMSGKIYLLFFILLFAACKKSDSVYHPRYDVFFTNTTGKPLTIAVYGSLEDYQANQHALSTGTIAVNGSFVAPQLEEQHGYFFDWYSDDYTYNNWYDINGAIEYGRTSPTY